MPEGPSVDRLGGLLDEIIGEEVQKAKSPDLFYRNAAEFVQDRLVYLFARSPESGLVWCPEWYRHAEALSRLDAVWRAWENLRLDPATGISNWWLHHADPHMRVLMDPVAGPFARCTNEAHSDALPPLRHQEPPPGLFTDQRGESFYGTPLGLRDD